MLSNDGKLISNNIHDKEYIIEEGKTVINFRTSSK